MASVDDLILDAPPRLRAVSKFWVSQILLDYGGLSLHYHVNCWCDGFIAVMEMLVTLFRHIASWFRGGFWRMWDFPAMDIRPNLSDVFISGIKFLAFPFLLSLCLSVSISCLSPRSTFHCWAPSPHHKPSLSITHCVCRVLLGFLDGSLSLMFNAQWIGGIELIEAALPMNEVASALGLS